MADVINKFFEFLLINFAVNSAFSLVFFDADSIRISVFGILLLIRKDLIVSDSLNLFELNLPLPPLINIFLMIPLL